MKVFLSSKIIVAVLFTCCAFIFFYNGESRSSIRLEEQCDNAIDDDGDGLIDLNDPDCICEVIEPISLIPNPSFEETNCCPSDRSQLNCADSWIQASEPTTDLIHTCGWLGWDEFPPPLPFPDGQSIMGFRDGRVRQNNTETNWKEYAGACLINPLEADTVYRIDFDVGFVSNLLSPPINITFFGTASCDNLPFGVGNQNFGCPTNGPDWVRLGSTLVSGGDGNQWVHAVIEVTPDQDIAAIAIGPDCPAVDAPVSIYYFFDNLLLADLRSFQLQISTISHPCQDDFLLKIPDNPDFTYQWYKDGIALVGETMSQLIEMHGEGDYQVRIEDGVSCRVSAGYTHRIPIIRGPALETICKDEMYSFGDQLLSESGIYTDTFTSINNCDSIVTLYLQVLGTLVDTVKAQIFEGDQYEIDGFTFNQEGEYLYDLPSSLGCDSLVLLQLGFLHVYIPNVFSPNLDGINDEFTIYSGDQFIEETELTIYDRWGGKVFTGTAWDGKQRGELVNPGVYIYVAQIRMVDGIIRQFSGTVTVLK